MTKKKYRTGADFYEEMANAQIQALKEELSEHEKPRKTVSGFQRAKVKAKVKQMKIGGYMTVPTLTFKETDTIIAKYVPLPVIDLSMRYLVEVLEPTQLVLSMKVISRGVQLNDPLSALKELLLSEWHKNFEGVEDLPEWMKNVSRVKLIECELTEKK